MAVKRKVDDALSAKDFAEDEPAMEPQQQTASDTGISREQLHFYYSNLCPFKEMFEWLSYGNDPKSLSEHCDPEFFKKREFSMSTADGSDEVYLRYRSYLDHNEWKLDCVSKCPIKIDIGSVYNAPPSMRQTLKNFIPVEKELVFDIDMTDYDDVRKCCDGAKICPKCWTLMQAAVAVLDTALREDFGFQNLLFVYSGRRGIHCWVCDERARHLSNEARSSIVDYLTFFTGGANMSKRISVTDPPHPSALRAYKILDGYFLRYVEDQDLFRYPEFQNVVLELDTLKPGLRDAIQALFQDEISSHMLYQRLRKSLTPAQMVEVVLGFIYPRLDVNVSKHMHHLLKSPFCVHPKTGRVCVPIDPAQVDSFDPFNVPTLSSLIDEADEYLKPENEQKNSRDNLVTSLSVYVNYFRSSIIQPILLTLRRKNAKKSSLSLNF